MFKNGISIVGTGYVGLSTAVGFASKQYKVIASTHDSGKVAKINHGKSPFYEPNLKELLAKAVTDGYLRCVLDSREAILNTSVTFIATGTPSMPDGDIDLSHIKTTSREIGESLRHKNQYHLFVVKSTVIPGTTEGVIRPALEEYSLKKCGTDFGLCMSPEFLRQGSALVDTLNPDRIVIGEHDKRSGDILETLYKEFYEKIPPIIRTNVPSAELIKYASNSLLATKISFINTIANLCEKVPGADVARIAQAVGLDRRIGSEFLNAGIGYGGSCFPKDIKAIIAYSRKMGYEPELLNVVEHINEAQPQKAVEFCKSLVGDLKNKNVAILGLAFKPNTDDMREARCMPIISQLLKEGATVKAYDPVATQNAKTIFKETISYASSAVDCLKGADCCILVTEWDEFKKLSPKDFIENMKQPILVDGRRIYNSDEFSQNLRFVAIGLGK